MNRVHCKFVFSFILSVGIFNSTCGRWFVYSEAVRASPKFVNLKGLQWNQRVNVSVHICVGTGIISGIRDGTREPPGSGL